VLYSLPRWLSTFAMKEAGPPIARPLPLSIPRRTRMPITAPFSRKIGLPLASSHAFLSMIRSRGPFSSRVSEYPDVNPREVMGTAYLLGALFADAPTGSRFDPLGCTQIQEAA